MKTNIRKAVESDKELFVDFTVKLSEFNRCNHNRDCQNDDYGLVIKAIKNKAEETFNNRNENTVILIAELENIPVGYALAKIYEEDKTADNGTGRIGLFDELFIHDSARGLGLGQELVNETIQWIKMNGVNRVKLHTYSWNNHAKSFYGRNGFKEYAVSYEMFI